MKGKIPLEKITNMEIEAICKLLDSGEVEQAMSEISHLEESRLSTDESIKLRLLKAEGFAKIGQYEKLLNLADQIIQDADKLGMSIEKIDAMLHKSNVKYRFGRFKESLEILSNVEKEIAQVSGVSSEEIAKREAKMKNAIGTVYTETGEYSIAIKYYQESLDINKIIDNKKGMSSALNNMGSIYASKGDYDEGLRFYARSVDVSREIEDNFGASVGLYNMASLYQVKGELDTSLEYLNETIEINQKFGDQMGLAYSNSAMGNVFEDMGKRKEAIEYYLKGLEYFEEIDNGFLKSTSYFNLVVNYIATKEISKAKDCLHKMLQIKNEVSNPIVDLEYELAEGIYLKSSKRFTERAKAQLKFKEVLNKADVNQELATYAMLYLFESLFSELSESGDEGIISEIEPLINQFETLVNQQNSHTMVVESQFIRSKLALLKLEIDEAKNLLIQAQLIAEDKGLIRLAQRVSIEHDNLMNQLEEWDNLLNSDSTFEQRIKMANMDKYVPEMLKQKIEENPETIEDEPILLLIMKSGGITLYTKNFGDQDQDDFLIGSFLSAINSFITKAFSTTGIIDIIRIQDYNLIMNSPFVMDIPEDQKITFCYMFKGYSYSARKKLNGFIEELQFMPLWNELISKNFGLSNQDEDNISNIVNKRFLTK